MGDCCQCVYFHVIEFFRSKDLSVYSSLADALGSMADDDVDPENNVISSPPIFVIASLMTVSTRVHAFLSEIPQCELVFATSLVMGDTIVEVPGRYSPLDAPMRP